VNFNEGRKRATLLREAYGDVKAGADALTASSWLRRFDVRLTGRRYRALLSKVGRRNKKNVACGHVSVKILKPAATTAIFGEVCECRKGSICIQRVLD
jgi:hypothetical protein